MAPPDRETRPSRPRRQPEGWSRTRTRSARGPGGTARSSEPSRSSEPATTTGPRQGAAQNVVCPAQMLIACPVIPRDSGKHR